ncbi:uncharacterized protein DEA37_0008803 [Paragonimus westermani]|uniref:Uncharacterized protein n=1 Tax=Paragonimus westermani TaxID=34504 RepID=A0A5J4P391_9TREM|nr:uncharacterized protein DEA37_0008803 [Paragonimus westermani]
MTGIRRVYGNKEHGHRLPAYAQQSSRTQNMQPLRQSVPAKADQQEAKVREKELEMQTKDEEMAEISKRIQQLETDKDTAQTQFEETNQKLDETEKRAAEVSSSTFCKILPELESYGIRAC